MAAAMTTEQERYRDALAAAGYTEPRGAVLFAALLAAIGALFGSVAFAILLLMLIPGLSETAGTYAGAAAGALLGLALAVAKVRRGNLEARELVEDREWKRQIRREHGKAL